MPDKDYEETRFVTDDGTVVIHRTCDGDDCWIGVCSDREHEDDPDVSVRLGPGLQKRVAAAILGLAVADLD